MVFLLITSFIFIFYWRFFLALEKALISAFLAAFLCTTVQCVMSLFVLGLYGWMRPWPVVLFNVLFIIAAGRLLKAPFFFPFSLIRERILKRWRWSLGVFSCENIFLLILLGIAVIWLVFAAFLLPPRGVDDLGYHLTTIFTFITSGRVFELPVDQIPFVAYPMNGEMLFGWALLFFKETSAVALTGLCFSLMGIPGVYALGRFFYLRRDVALTSGLLFFFTPVVLAMSGSGYVDVIFAIYVLLAVYFLFHYWRRRQVVDLFLSCIAVGFLSGIKYSALMFLPGILLAIVVLSWQERIFIKFVSGALIFLPGGGWYLKNYLIHNDPLFPVQVNTPSFALFDEPQRIFHWWDMLSAFPGKLAWVLKKDLGIGSFHGGLGIIFWTLGLAGLVVLCIKAVRGTERLMHALMVYILLVALAVIFLLPVNNMPYGIRFIIFVIPFLYYPMGRLLAFFKGAKTQIYYQVLIFFICLSSVFLVETLAFSTLPSYRISRPVQEMRSGKYTSKAKYACLSSFRPDACYLWDALDFISLDSGVSFLVAQAADPAFLYFAPLYGTRLQNRVKGFSDNTAPPDAVIVEHGTCVLGGDCGPRERLFALYSNRTDYQLVLSTSEAGLFFKKDILERKDVQESLNIYKKRMCYAGQ